MAGFRTYISPAYYNSRQPITDLEGARQAVNMCEYRLQVAWAHKFVDHAQGLVNNSVRFTHQNVQAVHILWKNSNKGKGKAV